MAALNGNQNLVHTSDRHGRQKFETCIDPIKDVSGAHVDAEIDNGSEYFPAHSEPWSCLVDSAQKPLKQQPVPFSGPPRDLVSVRACEKAAEIGSNQQNPIDVLDRNEQSAHHHNSSDPTAASRCQNRSRSIQRVPASLAGSEREEVSATSLSAYNSDHKNPNYTDLATCNPPDALENRLAAMRAQSAEENLHYRIPPEDVPPHMQMMVLLYQWAAWALAISDRSTKEKMVQWVNGRTLDFMIAGGRIPDYSLKELLVNAGVDPKDLYGLSDEPEQGIRSVIGHRSSHVPSNVSGEQVTRLENASEVSEKNIDTGYLGTNDTALCSAQENSTFRSKNQDNIFDGSSNDEDRREFDDSPNTLPSVYNEVSLSHRSPSLTKSSMSGNPPPSALTDRRKRGSSFSGDDMNQTSKRPKNTLEREKSAIETVVKSTAGNLVSSGGEPCPSSPDEIQREAYRSTFFKAQLNAVLKNHRRSQIKKALPDWARLEHRLRHGGLSVKAISLLRHDFHEGWKTWTGTPFRELPESLRSTHQPTATAPPSPSLKVKLTRPKPPSDSKPRRKEISIDYDSADDEYTASKTSVTTRNQASQSSAQPRSAIRTRGCGRGRGRGRKN